MAARSLPRIAPLLVLFCLAAAVSMPMPAGAAGLPIEGKLLVVGWTEAYAGFSYFMDGASGVVVVPPTFFDVGDISPDTTKVTYSVRTNSGFFHANTGAVWVANIDGSGAADLTGLAGLSGVNCNPRWSPDGRMIAFQHTIPVAGQKTCDAGFQVWLMAADGSNLHQWLPSVTHPTWYPSWAPDGYRLLCDGWGAGCVTADVTGENVAVLPGVNGMDAKWSRDGSQVVYTTSTPDTVAGASGVWRQLCLANADGSNVQVLAQQFLKDSDIQAHIAKYNFQPADSDWLSTIQAMAGPQKPEWSPLGDQVVFLAALPFDPNGPEFWYQREVWLYDLKSQQLIRLTYDANCDDWLSWAGPNTTAAHPSVTVDNATVTFSQVNQDGWTSLTREEAFVGALRADQVPLEPFFDILTTAQVSGPISVAMTYNDADVPAAAEPHLSLFVYDFEARSYFSEPSTVDPVNNVVTGQISSYPWLGDMGLMWTLPASDFSDVTSSTTDPYWALWEIEAAYAAGIVQGYSDGTYKPTDPVTRDQMAVYISRALAGGDAKVPTGPATATFSDVPIDYWAFKYVEYAVTQNVVKGYSDGTYKPTDQVTRDQMSVFIARAIATPTVGVDLVNYTPPTTATFPDVPTNFWAYKYVEYIAQPGIGVTKGYPDGDYHPEYICTRDQIAVYVARAFKLPV
jgi:Tol biopolymer transport system component